MLHMLTLQVAAGLSDILGKSHPTEGGFSWTLLRRFDEADGFFSDDAMPFYMKCNMKLTLALSVLDECFDPLKDPRTGVDIISQAVYNCGYVIRFNTRHSFKCGT